MAAGVTQPGGAGTTIHIYDDTHADAGGDGSYSFLDIYTAMQILSPGNVDMLDITTNERPAYAFNVRLQVGDTTTNAATTTLKDTNVDVYFAAGVRLQYRATQTTSWVTEFGTKVGTGNRSGAKNGCSITHGAGLNLAMVGTIKLYDCKLIMNGSSACTIQPTSSSGSEMVECTLLNTSTGNFALGGSTVAFDNLFNIEVCGAPTTFLVSNNGSAAQERVTLSATSTVGFFGTTVANIQLRDYAFKGTPSGGDFRWGNQTATNWVVVQPKWSGNGPKFVQATAGSMAVANGAKEYWQWRAKVTLASGAGVSAIPYKVTDTLGNVQIDTTTGSDGTISYGSGVTANSIIFMDHYTVSQVYTQRHRAPFLVEVNTGASRNPSYASYRYYVFPPGYEGVTTSAGTFEDVYDICPLEFASGAPSSWVELVAP